MPKTSERTQRERSEATTRALLDAGRTLFAAHGYDGVSLDDIASSAGVTKGALYHHFEGKRDLFRAVFEEEQRKLVRVVNEVFLAERDPWKGFYEGCRAFMDACLDPVVQRIALLDAPGALGWESMRALEAHYSFRLVREGLEAAMAAKAIARRPVEPIARLLFGAMCEGVMTIARSPDPRETNAQVLRELRVLLDALRAPVRRRARATTNA